MRCENPRSSPCGCTLRLTGGLSLLRHRRENGDIQSVGGEVVVEEIDAAGFFEIGKELAHFIPPNGSQEVGIIFAEAAIGVEALGKALGFRLGEAASLGVEPFGSFLNIDKRATGSAKGYL